MYEATISIPYFTGLPTDVVVNTLHFNWVGGGVPADDNFDDLQVVLQEFYGSCYDNASTNGLAPWMDPGAVTFKVYNQADPSPRTPVFMDTGSWPMAQSTGGALPTEVALCCSFQGDKVSGQSQARRRGRIYLGGWGYCYTEGTAGAFPVPSSAVRTAVAAAAGVLISHAADNGWFWNVWSRVNNSGTVVTNGWVDNAFDTQRRRGQAPTTRTVFF